MNNEHYIDDKPLTERLILMRGEGGEALTNVKQHIARHGSQGFDFGRDSAGASDLALNLVNQILQDMNYKGHSIQFKLGSAFVLTTAMYYAFRRKFIEPANKDGDFIDYQELYKWVEFNMEGVPA